MDAKVIRIDSIKQGMPGITPIIGTFLHENMIACMHKSNHETGVSMAIHGLCEDEFKLEWTGECTEQMKRAYQDELNLVENAAVCISAILSMELTDYTIVERSWRGTGIDYWLGYKDAPLFTRVARLEVSGIMQETSTNTLQTRVKKKIEQVEISDETLLPAYISVVEFGRPMSYFNKK